MTHTHFLFKLSAGQVTEINGLARGLLLCLFLLFLLCGYAGVCRDRCQFLFLLIQAFQPSFHRGNILADHINACSWGTEMVNVYEPGLPSHVRNAVNEAYRACLPPQPPVDAGRFAEAIVTAGAYADVWTATPAGNRTGVRADGEGRAWFRSLAPGPRVFSCGAAEKSVDLPARGADVAKPGFTGIPEVEL